MVGAQDVQGNKEGLAANVWMEGVDARSHVDDMDDAEDVRGRNLPNAMSPLTHKGSQVRWRRITSTRPSNGPRKVPLSLAMRMGAKHAQHTTTRWHLKREVVFHTTGIYARAVLCHNAADIFPRVDSA